MSLMEADAYSFHTASGTMDKVCAFCSRGEKSLLGQGELSRYEPTPGFNPFKRQLGRNRRAVTDAEDLSKRRRSNHKSSRRARSASKNSRSKSPSHSTSALPSGEANDRATPTVDELSLVGSPEEATVENVFEKSGHVWAHHCCAAWSEGVIQADDYSLQFVDRAVFAGLSQKCSYCSRYGATIKCRDTRCAKIYHYPCASGSGCFQDIKTLSLLCPDHMDQAVSIANQEAYCVVCDCPGEISDQLFCTSCGQHYHGNCLDPSVEVNPGVRAGWQCPECKICQTCRQPGDDNKMLVCDTCDKGYHTFCLRPVMTTIPKNGWKCKNCRVCIDCGARTPGNLVTSHWHLNYSVCDACYLQRNKDQYCMLCSKSCDQQGVVAYCQHCTRGVHIECDTTVDVARSDDYICSICRNLELTSFEMTASPARSTSSLVEDTGLQDIGNFGIFKRLKDIGDDADKTLKDSQETTMLMEDSLTSDEMISQTLSKDVEQHVAPSNDSTEASEMGIAVGKVPPGSYDGDTVFDPDLDKKTPGVNRQKSRTVGIKKKKVPTAALG